MVMIDIELSKRIAELSKPKRARNGQGLCYNNAFIALQFLPHGSKYVEGYWATCDLGLPIEHAWNRTPDGVYIDVSEWQRAPASYVPVVELDFQQVIDLLQQNKRMFPIGWLTRPYKTMDDMMEVIVRCGEQLKTICDGRTNS